MKSTANVLIKNSDDNIDLEAPNSTCIIFTHPYSKMGGSMQNNVTYALFNHLKHQYNTMVMFNFRGVGASDGWSTITGWDERKDVLAVCNFVVSLKDTPPKDIYIIGYSAGSAIACGCVDEMEEIKGYCAIAYPIGWWSSWIFGSHYPKAKTKKPKLFLLGDSDQFTSEGTLDKYYKELEGPKKKVIIPGADHFWFDYENHLEEHIEKWLQDLHQKE